MHQLLNYVFQPANAIDAWLQTIEHDVWRR